MIRTIRNHTLESRKGIIWEFPGSPQVRIWSVAQSSIPESTVRELGSCKQQGKKKGKKRKGIICTFPTLLTPKKPVSSQASVTSNTRLCKGGRTQPADRELLLRLLSQPNGRATERCVSSCPPPQPWMWWGARCWVSVTALALSLPVASGGYSWRASFSRQWLSCCGAWALDAQASVVVAHGLSCSTACRIFPDQWSNWCPLYCKADS